MVLKTPQSCSPSPEREKLARREHERKGESPLAPRAARTLIGSRDSAQSHQLSDRECEVLQSFTGGLSSKLIDRELGISEKTVKAHLTAIFQRIGVTDRVQAAMWARDRGIA